MELFDDITENYNEYRHVSLGEKFSRSFEILQDGFQAFFKYKVLLIPVVLHIILTLLITCGIFLYVYPHLDNINTITNTEGIIALLIVCFLICTAYSICSFIMLEFIQQIEMGEKIDIGKAFYETFCKNLIKGLPIIIIWTVISFIGKLLKGKRNKKTLLGNCITMSIFCIFPAIAWEDMDSFSAVNKGLKILKATFGEIFLSIIQKEFIAFILTIPLILLLFILLNNNFNTNLILLFVLGFFCFAVFVSTLCEYIGQLFTASIYMWYKKWERETRKAVINKTPLPSLYDIPMPSLLDDIPDLVYNKKKTIQ